MTAAIVVAAATPVAAFQLQPMSAVIDPDASSPTTTFEVRNTGDEPIAVQMRVTTRRILPDGTELNEDASDRFQAFPSQLILRPSRTQTVRVRWTGSSVPSVEESFRVVAEQLPINLDRNADEASGVRMMLRYRATLYLRPSGVASDIRVVDLTMSDDGEQVLFTVENRGSAHQLLSEGLMQVIADGERYELPVERVDVLTTVNVLPGSSRRLSVPRSALPAVPDELSFRFNGR